MSESAVVDLLERFGLAWRQRDVAAVLALMATDAVYAASVGPEPGRHYRGHEQIAEGLREMFAHDAGAHIASHPPVVFGERAVSRWTYTFDGGRREEGVDLWEVRDGKIRVKDAYRKTVG